jgi:hypothetical protein
VASSQGNQANQGVDPGRTVSVRNIVGETRFLEMLAQDTSVCSTLQEWADSSQGYSFSSHQKYASTEIRRMKPGILNEKVRLVFETQTTFDGGPRTVIWLTANHIVLSSKSGRVVQIISREELDYVGFSDAVSTFSTPFGSSQGDYTVFHFVLKDGSRYKRYKFMGNDENQYNESLKHLNQQIPVLLNYYDIVELGVEEYKSGGAGFGFGIIQGLD